MKNVIKNNFVNNVFKVILSNLAKLLSGIVVAFVLPKIIDVSDYGYYKVFGLYTTYVGVFHFGIIDGLLLEYSDKEYEQLDKNSFHFYTKFIFILEIIIFIFISMYSLIFLKNDMKFVLICLSIDILLSNMITYYQCISQIANRFNDLSFSNMLYSILICLSILFLWAYSTYFEKLLSYKIYILVYCVVKSFICIWYAFAYYDMTFGNTINIKHGLNNIFGLIKCGISLLLANLTQYFMLNIDRQFVSVFFDVKTYAVYAFAYSMLSLITSVSSAISTVLFPTMKKIGEKKFSENYSRIIMYIFIFVFLSCSLYFPLCDFINWFLPKYSNSLVIFRIILPGLAISSALTIVIQNLYKVSNNNVLYFFECSIMLILSIITNLIVYKMFCTTVSISISSMAIMLIWYIIANIPLQKRYKKIDMKNLVYLLVMSADFYLITSINECGIGLCLYISTFLLITYLFTKYNFKYITFSNE